ncbi:molecular chaperone [Aspergillus steynii IBT 23096]|uniref:Molecular chaperone n=1 Tax=Aspergillus steynii IBT 23096 TaxID=1392250 RepID=A0A2I2GGE2_9EURO|nr:molecular chaperone [Aspergillus steynii IBT 23096]PLB51946.1 molecular chaperone [Aspergillus steynii IBT 23096]
MSQTDSSNDFIAGAPADPADRQNLPNENGSADGLEYDDTNAPDGSAYSLLMDYPDEPDYYALLGLSRTPAPSESEIRSAFRSRTLSFHPDHQPTQLQDAAARHFDQLRVASETLLDPHKRTVYDLLGAEGVRREWALRGAMGKFGEARKQQVGVRAMSAAEFRAWFLETMKRRERRAVEGMVSSRGALTLGIDASSMITLDEEEEIAYFALETPRIANFDLKYSFKAPFPSPRVLLGDGERDDDDEKELPSEDGGAATQGGQSPYESGGLDMMIHTGIAGQLQPVSRKYTLTMEDDSEEVHEVAEPPILAARDLILGASVSRVFGDFAGSKGILGWKPFSFFSYSGVSATAMLLPVPSIETKLVKAVQPIPGTKPFRVNLSTTLLHSVFRCPPIVGVQVVREIGDGKHSFCNWSSGIVPWPETLKVLLAPFGNFDMDVQTALFPGNPGSHFEFGFMSPPKSPLNAATLDDDDADVEEEDEDEEHTMMRKKQTAADKAAESWQAAVTANPMTTGLVFNYARNIFSGKPANEVARSEWSSENHYAVPAADEPKAVRLEVQATVGVDLSVGWNIEGTRKVGDLTRMGLGVGLQGNHGLALTVSWGRLGQRIRLPITLVPLESVNMDLAAMMVLLPFASYCAWEFGFIRPRDRKNRRRLIARRQKQLKKSIPKKRDESAQAIALMTEQVLRRQAREANQNGLVITKAEYGLDSSKKDRSKRLSGYEVADVTIPVAALVDRGQLVIPKNTTRFHILGFHDPAPLLPKTLKIWYTYHGKDHYVEANDAEGIACPMRTHLL